MIILRKPQSNKSKTMNWQLRMQIESLQIRRCYSKFEQAWYENRACDEQGKRFNGFIRPDLTDFLLNRFVKSIADISFWKVVSKPKYLMKLTFTTFDFCSIEHKSNKCIHQINLNRKLKFCKKISILILGNDNLSWKIFHYV